MPLLRIATSVEPSVAVRTRLLAELSKWVAERLGKPEAYVMTLFEPGIPMTFGGRSEPACYVELKNIGRFSDEVTRGLSLELCEFLESALSVPKARIYIEFAEATGHLWGHDGGTFG
jgi:phenylpyruvate tautomerase